MKRKELHIAGAILVIGGCLLWLCRLDIADFTLSAFYPDWMYAFGMMAGGFLLMGIARPRFWAFAGMAAALVGLVWLMLGVGMRESIAYNYNYVHESYGRHVKLYPVRTMMRLDGLRVKIIQWENEKAARMILWSIVPFLISIVAAIRLFLTKKHRVLCITLGVLLIAMVFALRWNEYLNVPYEPETATVFFVKHRSSPVNSLHRVLKPILRYGIPALTLAAGVLGELWEKENTNA